ncbi:MAG: hypothetical protein IJ014_06090, partial [Rikenellaceae bacterium]|nr:hypothetical protein [Rikenellaceae bacterium]
NRVPMLFWSFLNRFFCQTALFWQKILPFGLPKRHYHSRVCHLGCCAKPGDDEVWERKMKKILPEVWIPQKKLLI